ncbi:MAG: preprotein translocase subunit SecG [Nitrospirota bacterium]|jgi:preprotein translocase subunit SecG
MTTFLTILHIFVSIILVGVVLLQSGKGASIGAAFGGGSSQTLFGSRGAASFLSKITTVSAIIFMLTSLSLAVISAKKSGSIVLEDKKPTQEIPVEKVPPATGPIQVPAKK